MLACPACGSPTNVRETRGGTDERYLRRRRICSRIECGHRITTFEIIVPDATAVLDPVLVSRKALVALTRSLESVVVDPDED